MGLSPCDNLLCLPGYQLLVIGYLSVLGDLGKKAPITTQCFQFLGEDNLLVFYILGQLALFVPKFALVVPKVVPTEIGTQSAFAGFWEIVPNLVVPKLSQLKPARSKVSIIIYIYLLYIFIYIHT